MGRPVSRPSSESSPDSLVQMIEVYRPGIVALAKKMAKPGIEADDLVGEAFLALAEQEEVVLSSNSPYSALLSISRSAMLNLLGEQSRQVSKTDGGYDLEDFDALLDTQELSAEDLYLKEELLRFLQALLSSLLERHAEVVLRHVLDEYSFSDIGSDIQALSSDSKRVIGSGISDTRAQQIYTQAIKRLKKRLLPYLRSARGRESDPYDLKQRILRLIDRSTLQDSSSPVSWRREDLGMRLPLITSFSGAHILLNF